MHAVPCNKFDCFLFLFLFEYGCHGAVWLRIVLSYFLTFDVRNRYVFVSNATVTEKNQNNCVDVQVNERSGKNSSSYLKLLARINLMDALIKFAVEF